ncbi:MAG: helix-turn-helix domain-containing protein [Dehalococcoidia bacterium]
MGHHGAAGPSTRERILAAARELFARDGYTGATVRAIGRQSGVSDAALYHHFRDKRALYDAVLAERPFLAGNDACRPASEGAAIALAIGAMRMWARQPDLTAMMFHQGLRGDAQTVAENTRSREDLIALLQPCMAAGGLAAEAVSYVVAGVVIDAIIRCGAGYPDRALSADGVGHVGDVIAQVMAEAGASASAAAAG